MNWKRESDFVATGDGIYSWRMQRNSSSVAKLLDQSSWLERGLEGAYAMVFVGEIRDLGVWKWK